MQTAIDYRGKHKYDASTALAYKDRPATQQTAEMALLDQVFAHGPKTGGFWTCPVAPAG